MRRTVVIAIALVGLVAGGLAPATAGGQTAASNPCTGTVASPANGITVISVQGARLSGPNRGKTRARLVAVGPRGGIEWVHRLGPRKNVVWSYDVDPLPNGNLFGTATRRGVTVFYELDPRTGEWVWSETVNMVDTHDADLLGRHRILIANMRNYNETTGKNNDQVAIYNRTTDEIVWRWRFRNHGYDPRQGGNYSEDWTHVNDVDALGDGRYLLSPRNMDQVIVIDRETGEIVHRLGSDGNFDVMKQQHNPQYLESEGGRPTILVADSENDRIVEYEKRGGEWHRTWRVGSEATLSWPRDADRLPNGNTLVVDSVGHRVIEVTPKGEVVWEFYAPWLVYDAERVRLGDEAGGPTIADQNAEGSYDLSTDAHPKSELESCAKALRTFENDWGPDGTPDDNSTTTANSPTSKATPTPTETADRDPTPTPTEKTTADGTDTRTPGQPGFGIALVVLGLLVFVVRQRS